VEKKKELFDAKSRLCLLRAKKDANTKSTLIGFCSFRFDEEETMDDRLESVVYWSVPRSLLVNNASATDSGVCSYGMLYVFQSNICSTQ